MQPSDASARIQKVFRGWKARMLIEKLVQQAHVAEEREERWEAEAYIANTLGSVWKRAEMKERAHGNISLLLAQDMQQSSHDSQYYHTVYLQKVIRGLLSKVQYRKLLHKVRDHIKNFISHENETDRLAVVLQQFCRAKASVEWRAALKKKWCDRLEIGFKSNIIQSFCRSALASGGVALRISTKTTTAAVDIQRVVRGFHARKGYMAHRASVREHISSTRQRETTEDVSVTHITRMMRGYVTRRMTERKHRESNLELTIVRQQEAHWSYQLIALMASEEVLRSQVEGIAAKSGSLLCQVSWDLLILHKGIIPNSAATTIQKSVKQYLAGTYCANLRSSRNSEVRAKLVKETLEDTSARTVQSVYRASRARESYSQHVTKTQKSIHQNMNAETTRDRAAVRIQSPVRGMQARAGYEAHVGRVKSSIDRERMVENVTYYLREHVELEGSKRASLVDEEEIKRSLLAVVSTSFLSAEEQGLSQDSHEKRHTTDEEEIKQNITSTEAMHDGVRVLEGAEAQGREDIVKEEEVKMSLLVMTLCRASEQLLDCSSEETLEDHAHDTTTPTQTQQHVAATRIQSPVRGMLARAACDKVHSEARNSIHRNRSAETTRDKAAVRIQSPVRGMLARTNYKEACVKTRKSIHRDRSLETARDKAAVRIQSPMKGIFARKGYETSRADMHRSVGEARSSETRKDCAAVRIQSPVRGMHARAGYTEYRTNVQEAIKNERNAETERDRVAQTELEAAFDALAKVGAAIDMLTILEDNKREAVSDEEEIKRSLLAMTHTSFIVYANKQLVHQSYQNESHKRCCIIDEEEIKRGLLAMASASFAVYAREQLISQTYQNESHKRCCIIDEEEIKRSLLAMASASFAVYAKEQLLSQLYQDESHKRHLIIDEEEIKWSILATLAYLPTRLFESTEVLHDGVRVLEGAEAQGREDIVEEEEVKMSLLVMTLCRASEQLLDCSSEETLEDDAHDTTTPTQTQQHVAATRIQSPVRGMLARAACDKVHSEARNSIHRNRSAETTRDKAAVRIQSPVRGMLARTNYKEACVKTRKSIHRDRSLETARDKAAVRIQSPMKGIFARKGYETSRADMHRSVGEARSSETRKDCAAVRIQSPMRGVLARKTYTENRGSVRDNISNTRRDETRKDCAAVRIQSPVRGMLAREECTAIDTKHGEKHKSTVQGEHAVGTLTDVRLKEASEIVGELEEAVHEPPASEETERQRILNEERAMRELFVVSFTPLDGSCSAASINASWQESPLIRSFSESCAIMSPTGDLSLFDNNEPVPITQSSSPQEKQISSMLNGMFITCADRQNTVAQIVQNKTIAVADTPVLRHSLSGSLSVGGGYNAKTPKKPVQSKRKRSGQDGLITDTLCTGYTRPEVVMLGAELEWIQTKMVDKNPTQEFLDCVGRLEDDYEIICKSFEELQVNISDTRTLLAKAMQGKHKAHSMTDSFYKQLDNLQDVLEKLGDELASGRTKPNEKNGMMEKRNECALKVTKLMKQMRVEEEQEKACDAEIANLKRKLEELEVLKKATDGIDIPLLRKTMATCDDLLDMIESERAFISGFPSRFSVCTAGRESFQSSNNSPLSVTSNPCLRKVPSKLSQFFESGGSSHCQKTELSAVAPEPTSQNEQKSSEEEEEEGLCLESNSAAFEMLLKPDGLPDLQGVLKMDEELGMFRLGKDDIVRIQEELNATREQQEKAAAAVKKYDTLIDKLEGEKGSNDKDESSKACEEPQFTPGPPTTKPTRPMQNPRTSSIKSVAVQRKGSLVKEQSDEEIIFECKKDSCLQREEEFRAVLFTSERTKRTDLVEDCMTLRAGIQVSDARKLTQKRRGEVMLQLCAYADSMLNQPVLVEEITMAREEMARILLSGTVKSVANDFLSCNLDLGPLSLVLNHAIQTFKGSEDPSISATLEKWNHLIDSTLEDVMRQTVFTQKSRMGSNRPQGQPTWSRAYSEPRLLKHILQEAPAIFIVLSTTHMCFSEYKRFLIRLCKAIFVISDLAYGDNLSIGITTLYQAWDVNLKGYLLAVDVLEVLKKLPADCTLQTADKLKDDQKLYLSDFHVLLRSLGAERCVRMIESIRRHKWGMTGPQKRRFKAKQAEVSGLIEELKEDAVMPEGLARPLSRLLGLPDPINGKSFAQHVKTYLVSLRAELHVVLRSFVFYGTHPSLLASIDSDFGAYTGPPMALSRWLSATLYLCKLYHHLEPPESTWCGHGGLTPPRITAYDNFSAGKTRSLLIAKTPQEYAEEVKEIRSPIRDWKTQELKMKRAASSPMLV